MKPNLVILQPRSTSFDSEIEQFCETFCGSHYVYLIRPDSPHRYDSPGGVRFLNHPLNHLPGFGCVETAVAINDEQAAARLMDCYPESKLSIWHPDGGIRLEELIDSANQPKVICGHFGQGTDDDLAEAM